MKKLIKFIKENAIDIFTVSVIALVILFIIVLATEAVNEDAGKNEKCKCNCCCCHECDE